MTNPTKESDAFTNALRDTFCQRKSMVADNSQEAEKFIFTIMDTKNNDFRAIEFGLNFSENVLNIRK